jgi:orotidine-5'-phosphate decarboxylase
MAAAFQDFVHYELSGRVNIGLGDPAQIDDVEAVRRAAEASGAHERLVRLPEGYETRLSRAFEDGADHIVVGRPIRDAAEPRRAAAEIQAEIAALYG